MNPNIAVPTFLSLVLLLATTNGFQISNSRPRIPRHGRSVVLRPLHQVNDDEKGTDNVDPFIKASWYAVEAFGKVFGSSTKQRKEQAVVRTDQPPTSLAETQARLAADNEREYFLSGQVDKLIYAEDCTFADPFVSFQGRDRFVENLSNLGSFITNYSARPLNYEVSGNVVTTKFMVKLQLNLPWKPILAWPWGVICTIDQETSLVTRHEETWDIEAFEGVKQIFRKPTTTITK